MSIKEIKHATANLTERLARKTRPVQMTRTIHHGVPNSNFSNQIRKVSKGSKKDSIISPYSRENSLYPPSSVFRIKRRLERSISGKLYNQLLSAIFKSLIIKEQPAASYSFNLLFNGNKTIMLTLLSQLFQQVTMLSRPLDNFQRNRT